MKAADLRQSILQMAVQGKLVPQNLHDEPASELLARIKAEKAKLIKEGKLKKEKPLPPIIEDEIPYDLPDGWVWCRLNEVFTFVDYRGKTPNKISSGIPLITGANIKKGYMDYAKQWFISSEEFEDRKSRGLSQKGDILFTTEAPLGHVAIADLDVYSAGQRIITLQSYGEMINSLYVYFLLSPEMQKLIYDKRSGMTATGIKSALLKLILIPLPPLAEQQRIVAKVDELMAMCDKLEAAEKELDTLERHFIEYLPKSILQMAVEGKLVQQSLHDEPASELLARIKAEKAKLIKEGKVKKEKPLPSIAEDEIPYDLPDGWVWTRLGEIGITQTGTTPSESKQVYLGDYIPFVKPADISSEGINYSNEGLSKRGLELGRLIEAPAVIMVCIGGSIGKCYHIDRNISCNQQINAITPYFSNMTLFVYFLLIAPFFYENICIQSGGTATPIINKGKWTLLPFPLPPLAEQQRIVAKVDELMSLYDELKSAQNMVVPFADSGKVISFPSKTEEEPLLMVAQGTPKQNQSAELRQAIDDLFGDGDDE